MRGGFVKHPDKLDVDVAAADRGEADSEMKHVLCIPPAMSAFLTGTT